MTKSVQAPHLLCVQKLISNTPSKRTIILVGLPNFSPTAPPSQFGGPLFGLSHFFFFLGLQRSFVTLAPVAPDPTTATTLSRRRPHSVSPPLTQLRLASSTPDPCLLLLPKSGPPSSPLPLHDLATTSPRTCRAAPPPDSTPPSIEGQFDAALERCHLQAVGSPGGTCHRASKGLSIDMSHYHRLAACPKWWWQSRGRGGQNNRYPKTETEITKTETERTESLGIGYFSGSEIR